MPELLPLTEILGYWLAIFLTFCILSFLYDDNPFYKFAEHVFIGVSIGNLVIQQYFDTVQPLLIAKLGAGSMLAIVPLVLCLMLIAKSFSRRLAWVARYPLAFVVALYAGFAIKTVQSDLGAQMQQSMQDLDAEKVNLNTAPESELSQLPGISAPVARAIVERRAERPLASIDQVAELPGLSQPERALLAEERGNLVGLDAVAATSDGERDWFGIFSRVLLFLGVLASLVYFYFSIEQKGPVGAVSRFGVWILMIGFGASFGYTVQGRLALAIGRAMDVLGKDKDPLLAERIHGPIVAGVSIAVIAGGMILWERKRRRGTGQSGSVG